MQFTNTGSWPVGGWALRWAFPEDYQLTEVTGGELTQDGGEMTIILEEGEDGGGGTVSVGLVGTGDPDHARPGTLTLNTTPCLVRDG